MKVCIDIQAAVVQRAGVGQYTKRLVQHLDKDIGDDELSLFYFDFKNKGVPFDAPDIPRKAVRWIPGRGAQLLWKKLKYPPFNFFAGKADLYHFPNFILPPLTRGKSVVTIHDVSFMRLPQFTEEKNQKNLSAFMKSTVERADAIITISQFSANEITELLGADRNKIFPIHLGVSEHFAPASESDQESFRSKYALDRPYILFVGTIEPRKNISFLIDIFENLKHFDGDLVIAGGFGWKYESILNRMRNSPLAERIRHIDYVDDSEICSLYSAAEALVFPSHYEGFGFPPIEAMACGTPVVSSTGGSLAEVVGDAAITIDTFDIERWTDAVEMICSASDKRDSLIQKGTVHASRYRWENTASETWKVYREVAG